MTDARWYAVWPNARSRSRSRLLESHSRGVDRQSHTGLIFSTVFTYHQYFKLHPLTILLYNSMLTTLCYLFSLSTATLPTALARLEDCIADLNSWFCSNGLCLNAGKSEATLLGAYQCLCLFSVSYCKLLVLLQFVSPIKSQLLVSLSPHLGSRK